MLSRCLTRLYQVRKLAALPGSALLRRQLGVRGTEATGIMYNSSQQTTNRIMMVRPSCFGSNPDTVGDNAFQHRQQQSMAAKIHQDALKEFTGYSALLAKEGVNVKTVQDSLDLPDSLYPNNWISFHSAAEYGKENCPVVVIYPMMSESRRLERNPDTIKMFAEELGAKVMDYSGYEKEGKFLEGTGSMVLDRASKVVYACLSQRTHPDVLDHFCNDLGYNAITFGAHSKLEDGTLTPIYHTNVMMSVGSSLAVVCVESITNTTERQQVIDSLENSGKEVVPITPQQMNAFAGNILQVRSQRGHNLLAMSTKAFQSLDQEQLQVFKKHTCTVIHSSLDTIETYGGGGARCMMAEIFPPIN